MYTCAYLMVAFDGSFHGHLQILKGIADSQKGARRRGEDKRKWDTMAVVKLALKHHVTIKSLK